MNPRQWFIYTGGKVLGPFPEKDLRDKTQTLESPLFWCRGQLEWADASRLDRILWELNETDQSQKDKNKEKTFKIKAHGVELPKLFTEEALFEELKKRQDYKELLIWSDGFSEWKQVFEIPKLMENLGVSRRAHPRVPISGLVTLEANEKILNGKALTISEGGMGINDVSGVKIGDRFRTTLKSPNLFAPVHTTSEVVYVSSDGYIGLRFIGIHPEGKSAIIEYVKKFSENSTGADKNNS